MEVKISSCVLKPDLSLIKSSPEWINLFFGLESTFSENVIRVYHFSSDFANHKQTFSHNLLPWQRLKKNKQKTHCLFNLCFAPQQDKLWYKQRKIQSKLEFFILDKQATEIYVKQPQGSRQQVAASEQSLSKKTNSTAEL